MPPRVRVTREMVADASFALIRAKGYESLNARAIAEQLGCSTQPVLYSFRTVDEIRAAAYEIADRYHTSFILPKGTERNPMLALGLNYVRFGQEEKNLFRFLFQTDKFGGTDVDALLNDPNLSAILELMARVLACGTDEARDMFLTFFCAAHGLASLLANNSIEYDEGQCRRMLESVYFGMLAARRENKTGGEQAVSTNGCTIRSEKPEDHRAVENLVRESFWNVYRPGCSEHYVIHVLRDDPAFVPELDLVMEKDGELIGQNMFMRTVIDADDGRVIPVLTMGPICITPALKRKGYGKALLDCSLEKAAALGFGAVLFEGNIDFYGKSGFDYARKFGIRYHDLPEGADDSFFLCRELQPGYLDGVTGVYQTPQGYYVDDAEVEAFDKDFPPKQKLKLPGQIFD